jgi:hypothetical protein
MMRKNIFKTLAIALFIAFSFGKVKADNDCTIMRTIPYLQTPTQNSMVVRWVTKLDCIGSVEYSTDSTKVANGTATKVNGAATKTLTHRIKLNNVIAGTKYYYRVCSKFLPCNSQVTGTQYYSDIYSFTTLKANSQDFKILILNDLHPARAWYFNYVLYEFMSKASEIIDTTKYDLVVFNGDCSDGFEKEADLIYWLDRFAKFTKSNYIPFVLVAGNHEYDGALADIENQYTSMALKKYIEFVHDGISYGSMKLGNTQLLFLDVGQSNNDNQNYFTNYRIKQRDYIDSLSTDATQKILIHHIPLWGECMDGINPQSDTIGGDLLNNANIVLAINAHTHQRDTIRKFKYTNTYPVYIAEGPDNTGVCEPMDHDIHEITILKKEGLTYFLTSYILKEDRTMIEISYKINSAGNLECINQRNL